jgi:hypothetical protein
VVDQLAVLFQLDGPGDTQNRAAAKDSWLNPDKTRR